jgi:hypothetical protein
VEKRQTGIQKESTTSCSEESGRVLNVLFFPEFYMVSIFISRIGTSVAQGSAGTGVGLVVGFDTPVDLSRTWCDICTCKQFIATNSLRWTITWCSMLMMNWLIYHFFLTHKIKRCIFFAHLCSLPGGGQFCHLLEAIWL